MRGNALDKLWVYCEHTCCWCAVNSRSLYRTNCIGETVRRPCALTAPFWQHLPEGENSWRRDGREDESSWRRNERNERNERNDQREQPPPRQILDENVKYMYEHVCFHDFTIVIHHFIHNSTLVQFYHFKIRLRNFGFTMKKFKATWMHKVWHWPRWCCALQRIS